MVTSRERAIEDAARALRDEVTFALVPLRGTFGEVTRSAVTENLTRCRDALDAALSQPVPPAADAPTKCWDLDLCCGDDLCRFQNGESLPRGVYCAKDSHLASPTSPATKPFDALHDPIGVWGELRPDGTREVVLNEDGMRLFPGVTFVMVEPKPYAKCPTCFGCGYIPGTYERPECADCGGAGKANPASPGPRPTRGG